jgi:hypothetical protein
MLDLFFFCWGNFQPKQSYGRFCDSDLSVMVHVQCAMYFLDFNKWVN